MKTLLRIWNLALDLVMLVLLLAAPVQAQKTGERALRRPERQPYLDDTLLRAELVTAKPAYARSTSRVAPRRNKL